MKRFLYILRLTVIYTLIFSVAPLVNNKFFLGINEFPKISTFLLTLLAIFIFNYAIFYLISLQRHIFLIFLTILFFISGLITFHVYALNFDFSYRAFILLFFEVNKESLSTAINFKLLLFLALCTAYALLQIPSTKKNLLPLKDDEFGKADKRVLAAICVMVVISVGYLGKIGTYLPQSLFVSGYEFYEKFHTKNDKQIAQASTYNGSDDLNVVVIIGESMRGDKFSLNGYERETNPLLGKVKNLFSFKDVSSCEVLTMTSVPCIITNRSIEDPMDLSKNLSFHTLFADNKFSTYWVNEQPRGLIKTEYETISENFDKLLFGRKSSDPDFTLPVIESLLEQKGKKLVVYHSYMSHWPYHKHYPERFGKWQPICNSDGSNSADVNNQMAEMKKCSNQELANEYDNSVLYTDEILNHIIGSLRDKNAFLIYTSDHGESLGEGGFYLHGGYKDRHIKEQRSVPLIIWASDKFLSNEVNRKKFENIKTKLKQPVTHDNIFHSVLDCTGFESADIDKNYSLCN